MTDEIPPGKMRLSDARELLEMLIDDVARSILSTIDESELTDAERSDAEARVDRARSNARAVFNRRFSNS